MKFRHKLLMHIKESGRMEGIRDRSVPDTSDMERFVTEENIAHYRKLLDATLDEGQRRTILHLLADQMAHLCKR